jgi:hypothetical protein
MTLTMPIISDFFVDIRIYHNCSTHISCSLLCKVELFVSIVIFSTFSRLYHDYNRKGQDRYIELPDKTPGRCLEMFTPEVNMSVMLGFRIEGKN